MEIELGGITYKSAIEKDVPCQGCIAENNFHLCCSVADHCNEGCPDGIIWIKKENK